MFLQMVARRWYSTPVWLKHLQTHWQAPDGNIRKPWEKRRKANTVPAFTGPFPDEVPAFKGLSTKKVLDFARL